MHVAAEWPSTHNGKTKHAPLAAKARVVPGMTRITLAQMFADKGYALGAEVGVADGQYSLILCQRIPGLKLLCIDPWLKYPENPRGGSQAHQDGNFALATQRLAPYDAYLIRKSSTEAARGIVTDALDFVYIDGNHCFDYVMQDLIVWSRLVRPGGMVAGHDYYHFQWAGVVEAVDAYTAAHGIEAWSLTDEREPSFYWVKH